MGGCQSTEAGDGQAIDNPRPGTKYVDGVESTESKVDRASILRADSKGNNDDTYITALPGSTPGGTPSAKAADGAAPAQGIASATSPESDSKAVPEVSDSSPSPPPPLLVRAYPSGRIACRKIAAPHPTQQLLSGLLVPSPKMYTAAAWLCRRRDHSS